MNFPIIIDNILPPRIFLTLLDDIQSDWTYGQQAKKNDHAPKFWNKEETNKLLYFECASYVKLRIQKVLKQDIKLIRIHLNAQTSFQSSEFHTDFDDDDFWTVVVFTSSFWNTNWSGELIVRDETINNYKYIPYFPNRGVLFPSNWAHRAEAPNTLTNELRTSIAFSYCPLKLIDGFHKEHNLKKYF